MSLSLHSRHRMKIDGYAEAGETVGMIENIPVYIRYGIPGEEVEVKITEVRKSFARGIVVEPLLASQYRELPPCYYFYTCGGCQWQHMGYSLQLEAKQKIVEDALFREGLREVTVRPTLPSERVYQYRNKTLRPISIKRGKVVTGFYFPGTHHLVDVNECTVEPEISNVIMRHVESLVKKYKISTYDEKRHEGVLRSILVREGFYTQEIGVMFVTNSLERSQLTQMARELVKSFPQIVSVVQNINRAKTNVILGEEAQVLYGRDFIYEKIGDYKFRISSRSFFQVNPDQAHAICKIVAQYANLEGHENVLDLYSGVGLIGIFLAHKAGKVWGIENSLDAVQDAQANAVMNGIENAEFLSCDVSEGFGLLANEVLVDVVILDPPRQGCEEEVLESAMNLKPKKIIYVSCYPKTLARDLKILSQDLYNIEEIQPVDLFPQTAHVETVVLLTRKN